MIPQKPTQWDTQANVMSHSPVQWETQANVVSQKLVQWVEIKDRRSTEKLQPLHHRWSKGTVIWKAEETKRELVPNS